MTDEQMEVSRQNDTGILISVGWASVMTLRNRKVIFRMAMIALTFYFEFELMEKHVK